MTIEEAIKIIKSECYVFNLLNFDRTQMVNTALDMACKALEKEHVIDKIKSEIESHIIDSNGLDFNSALYIAIEIIDKYTAESEG